MTPTADPPLPFGALRRVALAGDASTRAYHRLWLPGGSTAVLVEYPGAARSLLARDLEVLGWCREHGLAVPAVLHRDLGRARALLEDLGALDAESVMTRLPTSERGDLVSRLVVPLTVLAAISPEQLPGWHAPLDRDLLRWELAGFELWFLRILCDRPADAALAAWLDDLADKVGGHPPRVCHRDYHLNNLLVGEDGAIGVIDIQDIRLGPDTYDIVSLLDDRAAPRLLSDDQRSTALALWAERTDAGPGWRDRAAGVRLQRGLKVLGTFARFVVAGRIRYSEWMYALAGALEEPLRSAGAPITPQSILID